MCRSDASLPLPRVGSQKGDCSHGVLCVSCDQESGCGGEDKGAGLKYILLNASTPFKQVPTLDGSRLMAAASLYNRRAHPFRLCLLTAPACFDCLKMCDCLNTRSWRRPTACCWPGAPCSPSARYFNTRKHNIAFLTLSYVRTGTFGRSLPCICAFLHKPSPSHTSPNCPVLYHCPCAPV